MFFLLSKTLGTMLMPVNFLIGIGLIGAILLPTRYARSGRRLMVASVLLLALCGFSPLGRFLILPLEERFPSWDAARGAPDGIVVLGGAIDPDLSAALGRPALGRSGDRIVATAELARRYPNARVVFSGGNANLVGDASAKEADYGLTMLEELGVARERLAAERLSRNTVENAEFTKKVADPKPGERWLLVTSAYHMPRSIGLFRKAGFQIEAFPVDRRSSKSEVFEFSSVSTNGLDRTDIAMREWIGLVAYRLTGKIDDFLPGPGPN
ncbi:MAG TPA: YdcF family protein [Bradyrhizobium sp.]|uniref:YdcF family protein n=1 Tax=Bradyrhizobium sp. TaxID=376 RepID=UPI002D7F4AC0|nr:YdcF family protein [Bradyrhizobium sp.]HET7888614.1 YdcF family protein [Bradyrhizobium sp.]